MEAFERVKQVINENIALQTETANVLAKPIATAAHNIAECFLDNNKLLICASGSDRTAAQSLEEKLINHYIHPRPGLPAILLSNNVTTVTSIAEDTSYNDIFSKQIRALGSAGDILLIITSHAETPAIFEAINAAHEREIRIISLNATEQSDLDITIQYDDIYISVLHEVPARIQETHLTIAHCLCDIIDRQLLGLDS